MNFIKNISLWVDKLTSIIISLLLGIITISLAIQVAFRYLTSSGATWTEELAKFGMIWVVFLGAAVAIRHNSHIRVTIIEDFFPRFKKVLFIIQHIIIIFYLYFITYFGIKTLELVAIQKSSNMHIPMNLVYLAIPLFGVLSLIQIINIIINGQEE